MTTETRTTTQIRRPELSVHGKVGELLGKSRYWRSTLEGPECAIVSPDASYFISVVQDGKDPRISSVQGLLEATFEKEELEGESLLRASVDGVTLFGTPAHAKNKIFLAQDASGDVAAVLTGGNLSLLDQNGEKTNSAAFLIGYAVTSEKFRRTGLARELYVSALISASQTAEDADENLKLVGLESVGSAEKAWNSVGLKRIYTKSGRNEFMEVPYMQPPLDFDPSMKDMTGGISIPEHLMVGGFESHPTQAEILQTVQALYLWNNRLPSEAFNGDGQAHLIFDARIDAHEKELADFLANNPRTIFLDQYSRERARARGFVIHDHAGVI